MLARKCHTNADSHTCDGAAVYRLHANVAAWGTSQGKDDPKDPYMYIDKRSLSGL